MNSENYNISCDVYLDLIPLVRDGVASEDSNKLVYEHIANCEGCRLELENTGIITAGMIEDKKIIKSIKKSLFLSGFVLLICGAFIGIGISNSFRMFYNFLIMPLVGGVGYLTLRKKWYLTPIGIFLLSYIWLFIQSIYDGAWSSGFNMEILWMPVFLSIIYTILTVLGTAVAFLIKFALGKDE